MEYRRSRIGRDVGAWMCIVAVVLGSVVVRCDDPSATTDNPEFAPVVAATCKAGVMNIKVSFMGAFSGAVHARDFRNANCMVFGNGSATIGLSLNLVAKQGQSDYCGILVHTANVERNEERSVQLAVRIHKTLELADDKFYVITCGKTGQARDENSHVVLKFLENDKRVRETVYGRRYTIRAELKQPNNTYGIRVANCFAFNKKNGSIPLINDRGCPVDAQIISKFTTSDDGNSASAVLGSMFKFPDGSEVHLQCDVIQCNGRCVNDVDCSKDVGALVKSRTDENMLLAATTVFVLDPADAPHIASFCDIDGVHPTWLLWLAIALGVLFLIMLLMNIFLCTAMSCSCARTEIIEKEPSIIEEYDPYRSWHGSQYGSRYSLHGGRDGHNKGYTSGGSTIHSNRSVPIDSSDHYAIVHSRPGSRHSGHPGAHRSRAPHTISKPYRAIGLPPVALSPLEVSAANPNNSSFSSGDLSSECDDVDPTTGEPLAPGAAAAAAAPAKPLQQQPLPNPNGPPSMPPPPAPGSVGPPGSAGPTSAAPDLSLSFSKAPPPRGVSAPASPAKSRESLLQRVQSLTGAARDQGASIIGAAVSSATRPTFNKDRCFTLLVLDDQNTDWSKYFRGKRLHGDYDIRVEQAEFKEISLTANAETGTLVTMAVFRNGTKVARSFRPDFVLVRQSPRDGSRDFRSTLLGMKYGGVPCINSLNSIYQFQDKPWVFAHLLQMQRRLGKDAFPLVEQTFFPNAREVFTWQKYPCVLKAGHCHGGAATARLENQSALQDAAGLLVGSTGSETQCYCVLEPYIDAKFDIHLQKIGGNYKAFMRKSISGNWKTNQGSAMLEQITMTDKYRGWLNEISELFGGMEVCGLSIAVGKDGREHILGASDSTLQLMGDSQEDDRRQIADLVSTKMQAVCRPSTLTKAVSRSSLSSRGGSPTEEMAPALPTLPRPVSTSGPPPIPERTTPGPGSIGRHGSLSSVSSDLPELDKIPNLSSVGRRDSQASQSSTVSSASRQTQPPRPAQSQSSVAEDAEDTMKNLRKTFAGIFGDM